MQALVSAWGGDRAKRWARVLTLAAAAALPLQNTATVNVGFTLRVPDLLFALAVVVGLVFAVRGLLALTPWLRWSAIALFGLYALTTATSNLATIPGDARAGTLRAFVYLGNLAEGIAVMCLVVGLWRGLAALKPLIAAITLGAVLAALYAIWQWPAQHFGLPLSNVITTLDSNGVTSGTSQGQGILGWERVRGTFLEPHFLGAFMATAAPLAFVTVRQTTGVARRLALVGIAIILLALLFTSSAPAWASFAIAGLIVCAAFAMSAGLVRLAAAATACTCIAIAAAPLILVAPETLASATGRNSTELTATADFRKDTWHRVLTIWSGHPVDGYGAGQSSVRLTLDSVPGAGSGLQSAQGLWASALIDGGILGLTLWLVLCGAVVALLGWRLTEQPSLIGGALAMSVVAGLCTAFVTNDRLDLSLWSLFGIVAASQPARAKPRTS